MKEQKDNFLSSTHVYTFAVICILVAFVINNGSFNFLQPSSFGYAYASLAKSLLKFDITVAESAITVERFVRNGKVFMYFGPFPSLLRIPILQIFPESFGQLNNLSRFLAYLIGFFFVNKISFYALKQNTNISKQAKQIFLFLSIIGFGLASPLLSLTNLNTIFHEAVIWGLALSSCASYFIVKYLFNDERYEHENLLLISILTGLCLLSRVTFAIPLIIILIYISIKNFLADINKRQTVLLLLLPFFLCSSVQLWYNHERFGNIFSFSDFKYYGKWLDMKEKSERRYINKSSIPGFSFTRIPVNFKYYFLPYSKELYLNQFPYLKVIHPPIKKRIRNFEYEYAGPVFPFTLLYTWLFISSLIGGVYLYKRKTDQSFTTELIFYSFLLQGLIILMYKGLYHRYQAEFMPVMVFSFFFYLYNLDLKSKLIHSRDFIIMILLLVYSVVFTGLYSLSFKAYSYFHLPGSEKEKARRLIWSLRRSNIIKALEQKPKNGNKKKSIEKSSN